MHPGACVSRDAFERALGDKHISLSLKGGIIEHQSKIVDMCKCSLPRRRRENSDEASSHRRRERYKRLGYRFA